jgi:hypothetical protein
LLVSSQQQLEVTAGNGDANSESQKI